MKSATLCIATILVGAEAIAAPPMDAYGMTIGAPLAVPECPRVEGRYSLYVPAACVRWGFEGDRTRAAGRGQVVFPIRDRPVHSSDDSLGVYTDPESGVLQLLIVSTSGPSRQDSVFTDLVAKYGPPATSKTVPLNNAMGARFDSIVATWSTPELVVRFYGITSLRSGELLIGTPEGLERYDSAMRKLQQGRPL
jgi:hypothetical protein